MTDNDLIERLRGEKRQPSTHYPQIIDWHCLRCGAEWQASENDPTCKRCGVTLTVRSNKTTNVPVPRRLKDGD